MRQRRRIVDFPELANSRVDMVASSKKVLVLGATGVVGKALTNSLLNAKDNFERIGVFTSAESAASKHELLESYKARSAHILIGDLNSKNDVQEAFTGTSRFLR